MVTLTLIYCRCFCLFLLSVYDLVFTVWLPSPQLGHLQGPLSLPLLLSGRHIESTDDFYD
jgi:hypothetical protein